MTITTNNGHKYAKTHVINYEDGSVVLMSYTTPVIKIDRDGWLSVKGLYSMTTIKHIGWFMRERGMTYQLAKSLYKDGLQMNISTGEVKAV